MIPIRLSRLAADYVRKEAEYLRRHSPSAARNFASAIKEAKKTLQKFPEAGNRMHGLLIAGGRTLVFGDYLLDYVFDGVQINVTNIRHGRTFNEIPDVDPNDEPDLN